MKYRSYAAELIGTFLLAFMVRLSVGTTLPISTPVLAALTLGLIVYTLGPVSGAHVNPAVTIGLWSVKKIKSADAIAYIVAQCIGAALAMLAGTMIFSTAATAAPAAPLAYLAEAVGGLVFLFGIAAVVSKKSTEIQSGVAVGTSLLLGILAAVGVGSAGIINPAIALTLNSVSLAYVLSPIVGAVVGVWLFRLVTK